MLFSHICYDHYMTGAEKLLLFTASELQPHAECVLAAPKDGMLIREASARGIRTVVSPYPVCLGLYGPHANLNRALGKLARRHLRPMIDLLHRHRPDLVVAMTCVNPMPAMAAKILGIPVLWKMAETILPTAHTRAAAAFINRHSDWIAGVSRAALAPFAGIASPDKLIAMHPSWNPAEFEPERWDEYRSAVRTQLGIAETDCVFAYISADIYPNKGLEHYIDAALPLCSVYPSARFLIVGNPTDRGYYGRCMGKIASSGYAHRFHALGVQPHIQQVLPAADVVVMPSLGQEGFPLTSLEGMLFGKAVVAYASGGLSEMLERTGNQACLAPSGDWRTLSAKMAELAADEAWRTALGRRNRDAVNEAFGPEAFRERLRQWLRQAHDAVGLREAEHARMRTLTPGRLFRGAQSSEAYLIEDGGKRPFASAAHLSAFRYRPGDVRVAADRTLQAYPTGRPVTFQPFDPPAEFPAKGAGPAVCLYRRGVLHPIVSPRALARRRIGADRIVRLPADIIAALPVGEPTDDLGHVGFPGGRRRPAKRRAGGRRLKRSVRGTRTRQGARRRKRRRLRPGLRRFGLRRISRPAGRRAKT